MDALIIFGANYLYLVVVGVAAVYTLLQPRAERKRILLLASIALPLAYIIAKIGSLAYYDPRPFIVGNFTPLVPHVPDNGFPSDHTLLTAALASVVYAHSKKVGVGLWIFTLGVGASRVAAGVHHSIDIVGSVLIASSVTYAIYFFLKRKFVSV